MLVLTRKKDESLALSLPPGFVVPDEGLSIKVTVIRHGATFVRLGVEALKEVTILRTEIVDRDLEIADAA